MLPPIISSHHADKPGCVVSVFSSLDGEALEGDHLIKSPDVVALSIGPARVRDMNCLLWSTQGLTRALVLF